MKFMLGVLGSSVFWIIYGVISCFIGTIVFKKVFPQTYLNYTTGESEKSIDGFDITAAVGCSYLFWPVIVLCYFMYFLTRVGIMNVFKQVVLFMDKIIPEFKIVKK